MHQPRKIRAKWIFPVSSPPIENGLVEIGDGKIFSVGKYANESNVVDLGDVLILPALVNCHTHLEFNDLKNPLGSPGIDITDWIPLIVDNRAGKRDSSGSYESAVHSGLAECVATGTGYVGEIATQPDRVAAYQDSSLRGTLFFERLGADPSIVEERVADCLKFLQGREVTDWEKAISPHAPYSVHPMMLEKLVDISVKSKAPLAMHVAESLSEIEWIENQSGPFADLLQMLGAFFPNELNHYSVAKVIEQLSRAPRSLLIHGNYLKGFEIKLIAKNRGKMSVVFCPRTHQFFEHDEYPLADLLKAGIRVGLGTDSRASNPDLNLLREGQQVATLFTGMPPTKIVEMMTLDGAMALGCDEMYGSIEPGKSCRLVSIELGQEKTNPLEQILSGANFIARPILI